MDLFLNSKICKKTQNYISHNKFRFIYVKISTRSKNLHNNYKNHNEKTSVSYKRFCQISQKI